MAGLTPRYSTCRMVAAHTNPMPWDYVNSRNDCLLVVSAQPIHTVSLYALTLQFQNKRSSKLGLST